MCLTEEWLMQGKEREARRNEEGVKLRDAIEHLRSIDSTAAMIAWEMADWIYRNWTLEQIQRLPERERDVVMQYIDNSVSEYIDDNVSYLGVKATREKRRLERKAIEQTERNQLPLAEESATDDATSESPGRWYSRIASRLRIILLFLGVSFLI